MCTDYYIPKFFGVVENSSTTSSINYVLVVIDEDPTVKYTLTSDQEPLMDFPFLSLAGADICEFGVIYDHDLNMWFDDENDYRWETMHRAVELGILDMWEEEDMKGNPKYSWTFAT